MRERLCVIMPVYNEQDAIGVVLKKWSTALDALHVDYVIRPYNDGSKDNSLAVMCEFAKKLPHVEVKDKKNGGHGNTILTGYRQAALDGFDWVFQIDSDDEMGPEKFSELWDRRHEKDFLVGIRDGRVQALPRKVISFMSRLCVKIFYGKSVWDVNTPYRLMRVAAFRDFFEKIPLTTFAPNVILTGLAARYHLRSYETRVPQHDRTTGEVSIKKWKLMKAAARSFVQTIVFSFSSARFKDWARFILWSFVWFFAASSTVVGFKNGFREYDFQWDPAKLLMMGDNPYIYSLDHKPVLYEGFMSQYIEANQVPSCLLLLWPFTLLPQLLANQIWDVCNLIFTFLFLLYFYKVFYKGGDKSFFWIPALLLAGTPWRVLIGNGQHLMFSLAFFMPAYYFATKGKGLTSGILLALSAFKYTTIAPLAFIFIACKWWKPIMVAAILHIIATIGCGLWLHESPVQLVSQSLQVGSCLVACGNADLASLLNIFGVENVKFWANAGYLFYGILLCVVAFWRNWNAALKLALCAVISNIMFYHRIYDFVVLLFPLMYSQMKYASFVVRILTAVVIAWTFFICRVLPAGFFVPSILMTFVLHHLLLIFLLSDLVRDNKRDCDNAEFINSKLQDSQA